MCESITKKERNKWLVEYYKTHPWFSMRELAYAHVNLGYGKITRQGVCAALHRELKRREAKK